MTTKLPEAFKRTFQNAFSAEVTIGDSNVSTQRNRSTNETLVPK